MPFCDECGTMLTPEGEDMVCRNCGVRREGEGPRDPDQAEQSEKSVPETELEQLPTTDAGAVKKKKAVSWLEGLSSPSDRELRSAIEPKQAGFSGSTFPTDISNVRVTGDAEFIETFAGLLKPFLQMEDHHNRLKINLQETEDKEAGETTGNYALYVQVAERG